MSNKLINGQLVEETAEDIAEREAQATQTQQERQEAQEKQEAHEALKASAKAKLVAGEPLTEAEADTLVI
jgi:hypothetical protein|tara:strand:+ start:702 stop:911 length:210 start_codon:yes stop_codon:yes gene_type:complete